MRIDEMAKFGRRTKESAEAGKFVITASDVFGSVLEGMDEGIKGKGLSIITRETLKVDPLVFNILDYFDDDSGIMATDKGEYADASTALLAFGVDYDEDERYVYALVPMTFDTEVLDYNMLENDFLDSDRLCTDIYNALKNVKTNVFDGGLWNKGDLNDGEFITIPLAIGYDAQEISSETAVVKKNFEYGITEDITDTIVSVSKALEPVLNKYKLKK